jgi:ABC-2 type transport system permease protein
MLKHRFTGFASEAFAFNASGTVASVTELTPGRFLSTPGLWVGLVVAAAFLAAAVRLRRYREPI